ncbi:MAG: hypothetical protein K0Q90_2515 [Paenibacillaceae bacterium]|nr:hypothetical protein [Paenibacillaceae bacterium]
MEEKKSATLEQFDRNMRMTGTREEGLCWFDPREAPFRLGGFPWISQDGVYRRMPLHPEEALPQAVNWLADHTAGGHIRFRTDSRELHIRVKLKDRANMYHMAPTGQCGFDCYIGAPGEEKFAGTATLRPEEAEYTARLAVFPERELRSYTLYFPLYQGVEEVYVGVEEEAELLAPVPFAGERPVVLYGTSITQGGCASRPGMAYPNILSRGMKREMVNLGFSGSGKGEPEVARVIASLPDPACLVLDYEANCDGLERLQTTLPVFIRILRDSHPMVPVVVITRIRPPKADWDAEFREAMLARRAYQLELVERLRQEGDRFIFSVDGYELLGDQYAESTVDGTHPTDLGFSLIAAALQPQLSRLLETVEE